jgi:hypothetical protein
VIEWNVNDFVWVRLTAVGRDIHRKDHDDFVTALGRKWIDGPEAARERFPYTPPAVDVDGWSKFQGWHLMKMFGPYIYLGGPNPFETTVRFEANTGAEHD